MNMKIIFFILLFAAFAINISAQVHIIPEPKEVTLKEGHFRISPSTVIEHSGLAAEGHAKLLQRFLQEHFDLSLDLQKRDRKARNRIRMKLTDNMTPESYQLITDEKGIIIEGDDTGIFYGLQSLKQIIENSHSLTLPHLVIYDEPRFPHRGMMLDVARYYYPVEVIKSLLDQMAHYKLNVFHWHLTEDYGWRIEIKKYPELTQKGAWRKSTQYRKEPRLHDNVPHGGYYTQDEVREIVMYAAERKITVIPEIEMPGHAMAALAVYPQLSCSGGPFEIPINWGIKDEIFCAGNDEVFRFLEDVLKEVIDLFPSQYIHIGGDEAPKKRWQSCARCQQRIKDENLKNEKELQGYFVKRIADFLNKKGKKIIGWDEILEGGHVPDNAAVMSWRGPKGGISAANKGYNVIMAPNNFYYLDRYQTDDISVEPINIGGFVPLDSTYLFDPCGGIPPDKHKFVIGVQGNIWMEYIHSVEMLEYMMYPRILAVAESGWSPADRKDYPNFIEKMSYHLNWLDQQSIAFRIPEPFIQQVIKTDESHYIIELTPTVRDAVIFYSLDGEEPITRGKVYRETIRFPKDQGFKELKCAVVLPSGRTSMNYTFKIDK